MSLYVVDASVAAKWFAEDEEHSEVALALAAGPDELHAPDFLLLEIDNVLWKWVRRGTLSVSEASSARGMIRQARIRMHPFGPLQDGAYEIAHQTGRSVYDCLYVALARLLGAPMVTADRRLHNALADGPLAEHVLWVEDLAFERKDPE